MSLDSIIETLRGVYNRYSGIRLGIAGSYATGKNTDTSDLDIVIDGDSTKLEIMEYIKGLFNISVDVLWLNLLRKEDEELDCFAKEMELPVNENSVYKNVIREVIWI